MGPAQRPLHLLFLDELSADHLVDRRLHERRANRFPLASTLAEVRDELAVIVDVCFKLTEEKTRNGIYLLPASGPGFPPRFQKALWDRGYAIGKR